ncbi:chitooligosaccharide deacetylase [Ophiobolus disseminans]|uniref:chitin deacetylase n=1 Tax=Ophiobolus disseminans TaxID=1469910 RepID=A0A6A7AJW0_9PLEO|nr:chitooligosaccharide deacetylase [Ophiobolus disseminans]
MIAILFTILALVTPFYIIYKPPNLLIRYFQARWPDVLWHVPLTEKVIALTIDDAPSAFTQEIVDVLAEYGARATFFVIGAQVAGRQDVLDHVVRGGNELGNHAMHDEPSRELAPQQLAEELVEVEGMINATHASLGIPRPQNRYFRPGSGFFSARMREQVRSMGYQMVLGSVYPHDPQIAYAGVNARHVLSMVRPGAIVVCHDRRSWTVPMLRKVLPELKRRGYRVETVTELLEARRKELGT